MSNGNPPSKTAVNASKMHKKIGEILSAQDSPFKRYNIRQEYPVHLVNKNFQSKREKFDWAILNLRTVIEIHGKQHYHPVHFGGDDIEKSKRAFAKLQERDEKKKVAAEEAGWTYVIIKYDESDMTAQDLINRIFVCILGQELAIQCGKAVAKLIKDKDLD